MCADQAELEALHNAVAAIASRGGLDSHAQKCISVIGQRLSEFARIDMPRCSVLKGLIARLVVEQDPHVIPVELGARLIAAEKVFYAKTT